MKIRYNQTGKKLYETGVSDGVLFIQQSTGQYNKGVGWDGLTKVSESPTGGESTALYANNVKYGEITSTEEYGGTIEAYTYPDEFEQADGSAEVAEGVTIGQQKRASFGLAYKTAIGNDVNGLDLGYKIHLVYGAKIKPSAKEYNTINNSPTAITFSWEFTSTPVEVPGASPSATLVINSTKIKDKEKLKKLEDMIWGTDPSDVSPHTDGEQQTGTDGGQQTGTDPKLPTIEEIIKLIGPKPLEG